MASTYSDLKIELIGTGDQSGTWGTTTNTNLGTALGEAITGSADVTFASANATITLTDTNTAQTARNLRLNLTGTSSGTHYLILGSGCNIEKLYLVNNTLGNSVIVQNTAGGTSVTVPAGKSMFVFNTGTNIVDAVTSLSSLTLGSALPVASGGTGVTTSTGSGSVVLSTSPALTTPNLGTPSAATLTNATGLPISTGVSGLGTNVATFLATPSSANLASAVTDETGSGNLVFSTSPTLVTPVLGTPASGNLVNCTGYPAGSVTGTLAATSGGTGQNTYAVGDLLVGGATNTLSKLADVATGNSLISGGVGVAPSWGKIGLTTHVSGILPIANGGTNSNATATAGGVGYGTGTAHAYTAAGTAGQVLTSQGTSAPTWGSSVSTISFGTTGLTPNTATSGAVTVAGTLVETNGGTGQSTYTVGDILYSDAANSLARLADVATGNSLISGGVGVAPSWGKIGLTTHVSGQLGVGNGGTGVATLTGLAYGNGNAAFTAATAAQVVSVIGATAVTNATKITNSGGWNITPSGTTLYFNYNGTNVGKLDSSGNFTVSGNVTAYGTI